MKNFPAEHQTTCNQLTNRLYFVKTSFTNIIYNKLRFPIDKFKELQRILIRKMKLSHSVHERHTQWGTGKVLQTTGEFTIEVTVLTVWLVSRDVGDSKIRIETLG